MQRALGAAAAVLTWLGWLSICPALGFPSLSAAAMVNRALFVVIPTAGQRPGIFWLGWTIVIAALVGAIAVFFILERMRLVRASIRTGVVYGAALWLLVGLVVMPLLGFIEPARRLPANLDPMHPTLMMYSLGFLAPVGALVAWVLFGAIIGATWRAEPQLETARAGVPAR
jgi:uncharacterized membrane protein YagU involved in acid resistance